jgi:hypothetical protein
LGRKFLFKAAIGKAARHPPIRSYGQLRTASARIGASDPDDGAQCHVRHLGGEAQGGLVFVGGGRDRHRRTQAHAGGKVNAPIRPPRRALA